jgi:hypothetical protein
MVKQFKNKIGDCDDFDKIDVFLRGNKCLYGISFPSGKYRYVITRTKQQSLPINWAKTLKKYLKGEY